MRLISDSYELTELRDHEALVESLRLLAMIHSQNRGGEQFLMPDGKVTLELKRHVERHLEKTYLDVKRTTRDVPSYVKELVKEFGGRRVSGFTYDGIHPVEIAKEIAKSLSC